MSDQQPKLAGPARHKAERIANLPELSPKAEHILVIAQKINAYGFPPELVPEVFRAIIAVEMATHPEEKPQKLVLELGTGDEMSESELTIARWIRDDNQGIADLEKIILRFRTPGRLTRDLLHRWERIGLLTNRHLSAKMSNLLQGLG